MKWQIIIAVLIIAISGGLYLSAMEPPSPLAIGEPAPDFTLRDLDGQEHKLSSFKGKHVVLEWTNYECPFVRKHYDTGNMQAQQKKFTAEDVVWLSICSSAAGKQGHFSPEKWKELVVEKNAAPTAVLLDPEGVVGQLYMARTTPEMFIIDPQGKLVYMGAIDDKPGRDHEEVKTAVNYIEQAFTEIKSGKPVSLPVTRSYGCSVKY